MHQSIRSHPYFQHPYIQHDDNIVTIGDALDLDHIVALAKVTAEELVLGAPVGVRLSPGDAMVYDLFIAADYDRHRADRIDDMIDVSSELLPAHPFIVRQGISRIGVASLPETLRPTANQLLPLSFDDNTTMHTVAVMMLFVHAVAYGVAVA